MHGTYLNGGSGTGHPSSSFMVIKVCGKENTGAAAGLNGWSAMFTTFSIYSYQHVVFSAASQIFSPLLCFLLVHSEDAEAALSKKRRAHPDIHTVHTIHTNRSTHAHTS